jgi:hypothetical protein
VTITSVLVDIEFCKHVATKSMVKHELGFGVFLLAHEVASKPSEASLITGSSNAKAAWRTPVSLVNPYAYTG